MASGYERLRDAVGLLGILLRFKFFALTKPNRDQSQLRREHTQQRQQGASVTQLNAGLGRGTQP
jgi:hypothetical protein